MENNRLERLGKMLRQIEAKPNDLSVSGNVHPGTHQEGARKVEMEFATESLDLLMRGQIGNIGTDNQFALEAIVMPYYRPVVDIKNNRMDETQLSNKWLHLSKDEHRRIIIESTFKSIGRIEIPGHPILSYAGTGFIVKTKPDGRGILMTNRHVAEIFSTGIGIRDLQFRSGQTVAIDFLRECGRDEFDKLTVEKVLMIHPCWDMALLQVVGLNEEHKPLKLSITDPERLTEREVVTIGYPGYDPTGDFSFQNTQNRIFRGAYCVKRLQPGILRSRENIESYNRKIEAITHDCSTLGGNSGSAVMVLPQSPNESIEVIGLHFAGVYLYANYAVPTYDLATDSRVVDTGIEFSGSVPLRNDCEVYWLGINSESGTAQSGAIIQKPEQNSKQVLETELKSSSETTTWKIPIEVSVTVKIPELISSTSSTLRTPTILQEGLFGRQSQFSINALTAMFSLASLGANTFSWQTALSLAITSKLAYESKSVVESTIQNLWKFDNCKFIDVDDIQCFIASFTNNVLIAFRGTESLGDWLGNLNVLSTTKKYGVVHKGFYNGFAADVKQFLKQELNRLSPHRILLTGHSLGGALATVAAAEWSESYQVTGVYTFGQPAVGKGDFSTFFSTHYGNKFFRFVNNDDIVPRVPPSYQHVGKLFHFNARGELKSQTEAVISKTNDIEAKMMSEAEFDYFRAQVLIQKSRVDPKFSTESLSIQAPEGLFPSVSDHNLDEYIRKIKTKI